MIRKYVNIKDVVKDINEIEQDDALLFLDTIKLSEAYENYLFTVLLRKGAKVKNGGNLTYVSKGRLVDYIVVEDKKQGIKKITQILREEENNG